MPQSCLSFSALKNCLNQTCGNKGGNHYAFFDKGGNLNKFYIEKLLYFDEKLW